MNHPDKGRARDAERVSSSPATESNRLSLLADVATRLLMCENPEEIAPDIYSRLASHLDLDICFNYLVEEHGSGIRLAWWHGVPEEMAASIRHLDLGQAACGTAALRRAAIVAEYIQESSDPIFEVLRSLGVRAYACHPLIAHDLLGTLAFASRRRDRFDPEDVQMLAAVTNQLAVAIERGRLLAAYGREHAARRSAESTLVAALKDSETRLRTVLDVLPVGVFIADARGRMVLVNRAGERIWGNPPLASTTEDYCTYRGRMAASGKHIAADQWGLPRAIRGEESFDREIEIQAFDGERRTILNSAVPIRDMTGRIAGGVAVDVDITERKRAEDAVRNSEAILSQAGKMANLGAWRLDFASPADGATGTLRWSDEVYRIFGYEPGSVEASNELFFAHVHPDDRERVKQAVDQAIAERRSYTVEHRILQRDGTERCVFEYADIQLTEAGEPRRMIGAVQDITERKRTEEMLREAARRKNEFLATLSHELRNPLAPIRYALDLLGRSAGGDTADERLKDVIERQLGHLVRLVDDLLDVTRIESNKIRLRRKRVELRNVLAHSVEAARPQLTAGRHDFEVAVPEEPIWLLVDPDRIAQVVTNVLNNAARYTPAGGRISLTATRNGDRVLVSVQDNGIGLEPADIGRVFDMFAQVGEPGHGGLGIGLALVKGLVEMHGGTVEAHSAGLGRGSTFRISLPVAQEFELQQARPAFLAQPACEARRVLVVDDNADAAEMTATLLQMRGHDVRTAFDGRSALVVARQFQPQVGIFDIGLPGMSGYELARQVRADAALKDMYLVAVTGWGQDEDRRLAREAGFDAHLTKPADPDALEHAVRDGVRVA